MLLDHIGDRKVLFFGGKGGVGKTTTAAATALMLAEHGKKVLLVSTDPAHNLGHLFGVTIGDELTPLTPTLTAVEIDPQATTQAHLDAVGHTMRRMMPDHLHKEVTKHLQLAEQSPGTHEAAILERIAHLVAEQLDAVDHLIVDTAPSGHTARLMALPELMAAWTEGLLERRNKSDKLSAAMRGLGGGDSRSAGVVGGGALDPIDRRNQELRSILLRRRELFAHLRGVLGDQQQTSFVLVLAAERMPVLETVELHEQLTATGMNVGAFVINRRSPTDQGEFLAARHDIEDGFVAQLSAAVTQVPIVQVPLLPGDVTGVQGLAGIVPYLAA